MVWSDTARASARNTEHSSLPVQRSPYPVPVFYSYEYGGNAIYYQPDFTTNLFYFLSLLVCSAPMEQMNAHLFGKPDVLEAPGVKVKGIRVGSVRHTTEGGISLGN